MSGAGAPAGWPARLRSGRVALRVIAPADERPGWLDEAERAVLGAEPGCPLDDRRETGDALYWLRVTHDGDPATVGACAARIEGSDLVWTWLAVGGPWRAFGYGGAAVPVVEGAARRLGATGARVRVPASNGVALYFWLRLGYRPVAAGEPGWGAPYPGTWMVR